LGRKRNWWSNSSFENFEKKCSCYVDQYSQIEINGSFINGRYTLAENIADNSGLFCKTISLKIISLIFLIVSWNAYKSFERYFKLDHHLSIPEYSNDQLFFISLAQVNCVPSSFINPWDTHSPFSARISGMLMNSPEFSKAFNCPLGSNFNPEKKCFFWEQIQ
jgi:endothelin-converting enzyme